MDICEEIFNKPMKQEKFQWSGQDIKKKKFAG